MSLCPGFALHALQEAEDERGYTRLILIIRPRVALTDEVSVIQTILNALSQNSRLASLASAVWGQAQTLRIKRAAPEWTARGKLNPLHLTRLGRTSKTRLPPTTEFKKVHP